MASFDIKITKRAKRDLKKMDPQVRKSVTEAIDELAKNPRPPSSRRMKGEYKDYWRERTGNYRIIYKIQGKILQITVIRASHRKDIYR